MLDPARLVFIDETAVSTDMPANESRRHPRQLMEQLYRWFVGLGVDEPVWVPTVFTKNRDPHHAWHGGQAARRREERDSERTGPLRKAHSSNEVAHLLRDARAASRQSGCGPPVSGEPLTMPAPACKVSRRRRPACLVTSTCVTRSVL
jgi:hypothetical protein